MPFDVVQGLIQIWKTKGIVEVGEEFVNGDLFAGVLRGCGWENGDVPLG
jgi:hypothetical protein